MACVINTKIIRHIHCIADTQHALIKRSKVKVTGLSSVLLAQVSRPI